MEVEGICNGMEGTLGNRSAREEKMKELGDGRDEGREEETSIRVDVSTTGGGEEEVEEGM
ncbi:hypothetical protein KI387_007132, partial [Taxus chinensis]